MAKKSAKAVQKVEQVVKSPLKAVQKPQKAGKQKTSAEKDAAFFQKMNKKLKEETKKKIESEDENSSGEEEEEDSGADVVAEEEEDDEVAQENESEEEEDDEEDEDVEAESEEDNDDDDNEEEDNDNSDEDAPEETAIKKTAAIDNAPKEKKKKKTVESKKKEQHVNGDGNLADENAICVRKLVAKVTEDDIVEHFSKYGDVAKVTIKHEKHFAFVYFKNADQATEALKAHNSQLSGSNIGVYPKVKNPKALNSRDPKKTVLVKNVDQLTSISAEDLSPIFAKYGEIADMEILCGRNVLAFVTYKNEESVQKCLKLDGTTVNNIKLVVSEYQTLQQSKTSVFVQNVKPGVTKEEIEELFSQCGPIENVFVRSGFAIVKFKDTESFCKSFLLNEEMLHGQMIFLEPHSMKKQSVLKSKSFGGQKYPRRTPNHQGGPHKRPSQQNHKGGPQKRFKK